MTYKNIPVRVTTASLEPGDNVSELVNDAGYLTVAGTAPDRYQAKKVADAAGSIGINATTVLTQYTILNFTPPTPGNYDIFAGYIWSHNAAGNSFVAEVRLDGGLLKPHRQEPKDPSGVGVVLSQVGGGTANSGTSQRYSWQTASYNIGLTAAPHTVEIFWATANATTASTIYEAEIMARRVL